MENHKLSPFSQILSLRPAGTAKALAADNALWFKRSSVWSSRATGSHPTILHLPFLPPPPSFASKPCPPFIIFDQRVRGTYHRGWGLELKEGAGRPDVVVLVSMHPIQMVHLFSNAPTSLVAAQPLYKQNLWLFYRQSPGHCTVTLTLFFFTLIV